MRCLQGKSAKGSVFARSLFGRFGSVYLVAWCAWFVRIGALLGGADDGLQRAQQKQELSDDVLMQLANRYAPILFYDSDEPNLPTSVDRFLAREELWFFSKSCRPAQRKIATVRDLKIPATGVLDCGSGRTILSNGTRSTDKETTFYLTTVPPAARRGSLDSEEWITYVHGYRNDLGGITLQFWRFYAYNTGYMAGIPAWGASHGGDWEAIHVVLGPEPALVPVQIRLLGHTRIATLPWPDVLSEGGHPLIRCSKGGHTSLLMTRSDLTHRGGLIEQGSWTGGAVRWPDGRKTRSGRIILLGSKTLPANNQEWLRYSGLWGTRESSGILTFYRSGYWGPAFNETGMSKDGFIAAWCAGMARTHGDEQAFRSECYASSSVP